MRVVGRTLEAVMAAGYEGLEAAVVYRAVGQEEYPHIWRVRDELPLVTDDDVVEAVLAIVITGICARAAAVHVRRPSRRCRGGIKGRAPGRNFRSYPRNLWTSCA